MHEGHICASKDHVRTCVAAGCHPGCGGLAHGRAGLRRFMGDCDGKGDHGRHHDTTGDCSWCRAVTGSYPGSRGSTKDVQVGGTVLGVEGRDGTIKSTGTVLRGKFCMVQ